MEIAELARTFIENSPGFHKDLELDGLDEKHIKILTDSYKQEAEGSAFREDTFRNWKGQSDMDVPVQLTRSKLLGKRSAYNLAKYFYINLFRREHNKMVYNTLLDDMAVIREIGGNELLAENPVHATPGATFYYEIDNTSVNMRWLRYIYLLKRILDFKILGFRNTWVDVGSYYGGLQGLVHKYCPESISIMVDFHHQLCRSYIYLKQLYPESRHIFPNQMSEYSDASSLPPGAFIYVPVSQFQDIENWQVDLVTNFFSLGEMRRKYFSQYWESPLFTKSELQFMVNRFVSSPFFEPTYDSDITVNDYLHSGRELTYFDVFPMHHFMQISRSLFGRVSGRNTSSSYFELVTNNPSNSNLQ